MIVVIVAAPRAAHPHPHAPPAPPSPIAQVGDVWVNLHDLYDYTIVSIETVGDLVIYGATWGRATSPIRIKQTDFERNFVKRSAAPAPDSIAKRKAQVAAKRLRDICNNLEAYNLADYTREIREKTIPLLETIE